MKKNIWIILGVAAFVVFLAVSVMLYDNISENYDYTSEKTEKTEETEKTEPTEPENPPAPDFTVYNENGEEVKLSSFKGKPVVVNFWATWGGVCENEFPAFENVYKSYGDKVDFVMVNLTDDYETTDKAKSFIEERGYTFPIYYDKDADAAKQYAVSAIPVTVFVDKDGGLLEHRIGGLNESMLVDYIEMLLEE